jgi:hypothetical protein
VLPRVLCNLREEYDCQELQLRWQAGPESCPGLRLERQRPFLTHTDMQGFLLGFFFLYFFFFFFFFF